MSKDRGTAGISDSNVVGTISMYTMPASMEMMEDFVFACVYYIAC